MLIFIITMRRLNLNKLKEGLPVLSKNRGASMAEAVAFCLTMQGFKSGVVLKIEGDYKESFEITWTDIIDDQVKKNLARFKRSNRRSSYGN